MEDEQSEASGPSALPPLIGGRYELARELGREGTLVLYAARDSRLDREVLLKRCRRDSPDADRLLAEARAGARLDHPGVLPVLEAGRDHAHAYFTMRSIEGGWNVEAIARRARDPADAEWSLARALAVLVQVCETLSFAHSKGVVHGALTSERIRVGSFGEVRVDGWGAAREGADAAHPSTDIRAVGELLDRLLPARSVPPELASIRSRAATSFPQQGYPDVDALGRDIRAFLERRVVRAHRTGAFAELSTWLRRNRRVALLAGTVLALLPSAIWLGRQALKARTDRLLAAEIRRTEELEALLDQGFSALENDAPEAALDAFGAALAAVPGSREALMGVVMTHLARKQPQVARSFLADHAASVADSAGLRCLSVETDALLGLGDRSALLAIAAEAATALDHFAAGMVLLQGVERGQSEYASHSRSHFLSAVLLDGSRRMQYAQLIHAAGHAGDETLVERAGKIARQHWPDSPQIDRWLGYSFNLLERAEEARPYLERACNRLPEHYEARVQLWKVQVRAGLWEGARDSREHLKRLGATPAKLAQLEAAEHQGRGDTEAARRAYARWADLVPRPEPLLLLATLAQALGDEAELQRALDRLSAMEVDNLDEKAVYACLLYFDGRTAEALEVAEELVLARRDPADFTLLGTCQEALGLDEQAIVSFRTAVELSGQDPEEMNELIDALVAKGRTEEVLPYLSLKADAEPENGEVQHLLAETLYDLGAIPQALRRFERALELDPDHRHAELERLRTLDSSPARSADQ